MDGFFCFLAGVSDEFPLEISSNGVRIPVKPTHFCANVRALSDQSILVHSGSAEAAEGELSPGSGWLNSSGSSWRWKRWFFIRWKGTNAYLVVEVFSQTAEAEVLERGEPVLGVVLLPVRWKRLKRGVGSFGWSWKSSRETRQARNPGKHSLNQPCVGGPVGGADVCYFPLRRYIKKKKNSVIVQ